MTPDPASERRLRDLAVRGDPEAWRRLFDAAYDRVRAYCRWRCGELRDVADDCEQQTWLVAVARLRRFDPRHGPFAAWVVGVAANVVRAEVRRRTRRGRPLSAEPAAPCDAARRERAEAVAAALSALPARYEAVLRAKYLDGDSVETIAAATSSTPKAVESLLTRAREAFRTAYPEADP